MFRMRFLCLTLAVCSLLSTGALAAEVDCDSVYCFREADFAGEEPLAGICVTGLPEASAGTVMLGARVVCPGDILTADQLAKLTFLPLQTPQDKEAVVEYLPIYANRVAPGASMTISIRGKVNQPPQANDDTLETYKNLPNTGTLKVTDPEGEELTYSVVRGPKRGQVEISQDGRFVYTPKKNKVGVDSFTYTATDPQGNVSREATVTVQILKPTDAKQYTDTLGEDCRFAAEWMRNTGLFVGERLGGQDCFYPDKTVSCGEFLAMLVQTLELPLEETSSQILPEDTPQWLRPYLAAALRSGLAAGWWDECTDAQTTSAPITAEQAALLLQNALDLDISRQTVETAMEASDQDSAWTQTAMAVLAENGIVFTAGQPVTRAQAAITMYRVSQLALYAPGLTANRNLK